MEKISISPLPLSSPFLLPIVCSYCILHNISMATQYCIDPPKEVMVTDVTEDAVTISWIKPMASFEYYKLSYQSVRGRVDSVVIDSDVTNYTLSSLFPATEYEISLNAVRGSQESKVVSNSVFTGGS
ncbi:hypothetical protein F2P81_025968 [Scophthalmus maximus]|uniref:Fibronectin type-III domain-containing protein n=1 Tax=Scophthalmus maximus TaxID=52904 RepID=A0A6A4RND9_SCOMX|nr:hypothetical protein F2P81_025968 [Scophthalmus maximus]